MTIAPRLEPLTHKDLGGLLALNATTGWTLGRDDWLTVLTAGRFMGHKTEDGHLVSCGAISPFSAQRGSLGLVIVHPDYQGRGMASQLLEGLVGRLKEDHVSICLIATPDGIPLYEKFGFKQVGEIIRGWATEFDAGPIESLIPAGWKILESLPLKDLKNIIQLDESRYGAPRSKMLKRRMGQSDTRAFLYDENKVLQGYALGSKQEGITVIGAVTAPDDEGALALIQSVCDRASPRYQVDIPCRHPDFIKKLEAAGMDWEYKSPIMVRGKWDIEAGWDQYYALATQSFL